MVFGTSKALKLVKIVSADTSATADAHIMPRIFSVIVKYRVAAEGAGPSAEALLALLEALQKGAEELIVTGLVVLVRWLAKQDREFAIDERLTA